jgi:sodium/potassium-transporting ATPase subunit alpha
MSEAWGTTDDQLTGSDNVTMSHIRDTNTQWMTRTGCAADYDNFYNFRNHVLSQAQTAYFYAIITSQVANILICRTRYESLFKSQINKHVIVGICVELIVMNLLAYCPGITSVFGTTPIPFVLIALGLPTIPIMIAFDEARKWWLRNNADGWIGAFTDY